MGRLHIEIDATHTGELDERDRDAIQTAVTDRLLELGLGFRDLQFVFDDPDEISRVALSLAGRAAARALDDACRSVA